MENILQFFKSIPKAGIDQIALDAGAGNQNKKPLIVQKSYEYESCDFEDIFESNFLKKQTYVCSVEDLTMEDDRYDLVISCQVLEHLPNPAQAMREMTRVMKPGGLIFLSTNFLYPRHGAPHDYFRFTENALRSLALRSGLELISIKPRGGFLAFMGQVFSELPLYFRNYQVFGTSNPSKENKVLKRRLPLVLLLLVPTFAINIICFLLANVLHSLDFLDKENRFTLGYALIAKKK